MSQTKFKAPQPDIFASREMIKQLGSADCAIVFQTICYLFEHYQGTLIDDEKLIHFSYEEISDRTGLSPQNVGRCIRKLESIGWLRSVQCGGQVRTKHYSQPNLEDLGLNVQDSLLNVQCLESNLQCSKVNDAIYKDLTENTTEKSTEKTHISGSAREDLDLNQNQVQHFQSDRTLETSELNLTFEPEKKIQDFEVSKNSEKENSSSAAPEIPVSQNNLITGKSPNSEPVGVSSFPVSNEKTPKPEKPAPPRDRMAEYFRMEGLPEHPWQKSRQFYDFDEGFVEFIRSKYLSTVPSYEGKQVSVGDAKRWINGGCWHDLKRKADCIFQWQEYQASLGNKPKSDKRPEKPKFDKEFNLWGDELWQMAIDRATTDGQIPDDGIDSFYRYDYQRFTHRYKEEILSYARYHQCAA